jgi:hypothetical protein
VKCRRTKTDVLASYGRMYTLYAFSTDGTDRRTVPSIRTNEEPEVSTLLVATVPAYRYGTR